MESFTIKPIPGFPDYGVTVDGRIFSQKRGPWRELRAHLKGKGGPYLKIKLYTSPCEYRQISIHQLVARTFIGPPPEPPPGSRIEVNHKDFRTTNNAVSNLEWMTQEENMQHAIAGGRIPGVSPLGLSDEEKEQRAQQRRIRERIRDNAPSRKFERRLQHSPPRPVRRGTQLSNHRLNEYEVRTIRSLYPSHSLGVLGRMYGVSKQQIHRIVRGEKWRHVE